MVFVLLTLLFWIGYLRYKKQLDAQGAAFLVLFFLGQPMVFEQAGFVRMYAPLGFVFSIATVCLWELKEAWGKAQMGFCRTFGFVFIRHLDPSNGFVAGTASSPAFNGLGHVQ